MTDDGSLDVYRLKFPEDGFYVSLLRLSNGKAEIHFSITDKKKFRVVKIASHSKKITEKIIGFAKEKGIKELIGTSHLLSRRRLAKRLGFEIVKGNLPRKLVAIAGQNLELIAHKKPLSFRAKTGVIHVK